MATVSLTDLPRALREITGQTPTYRQLWEKTVCGDVRVTKKGARYFADPMEVAQDLGLTIRTTKAA